MSDKKMIIRNCPCFIRGIAIKGNEQKTQTCNNHRVRELTLCQDCTDCVLKQIVELCKDYYKNCEIEGNCIDDRTCTSCFFGGGNELAQDILSNLDIQEVE